MTDTDSDVEAAEEFAQHRPRLLGVAYRLLGSMWDAEDIVADAQVKWLALDRGPVWEPAAFLTTMVTRLALDQLRSARNQRETYLGPWLPEPVLTDPSPLDAVTRRESISLASLYLMEQLTPPERAVFILREVFDVPYAEVAETLDITQNHARQLLYRARAHLKGNGREAPGRAEDHGRLLDEFLHAVQGGDLAALQDLLAEDVVAYNDGGGKARAAVRPVVGADNVMRFVAGLLDRFTIEGELQPVEANGLPAMLFTMGGQEQLMALDVQAGKIQAIYGVLNPDKLDYLRRQLAEQDGSDDSAEDTGGAQPA